MLCASSPPAPPPQLRRAWTSQVRAPSLTPLTSRECDVLRLLALGHTNAEVAERLHLSVRTVETHRANIQSKLGSTSRADLVRHARESGLVAS